MLSLPFRYFHTDSFSILDAFDLINLLSKEHTLLESVLIVIVVLLTLALLGLVYLSIRIAVDRSNLKKDVKLKDDFIMERLVQKDNISNESLKNSVNLANKSVKDRYQRADRT
jgi:hypothetical protein